MKAVRLFGNSPSAMTCLHGNWRSHNVFARFKLQDALKGE